MGVPKIPGQFARPPFKVPALPSPPAVFAVPANVTASIASLGAVASKLAPVVKNPFATVNATRAQTVTQAQAQAQNAARTKLSAVHPPAALPSSVVANPSAVSSYTSGMRTILGQGASPVDEFGQPVKP